MKRDRSLNLPLRIVTCAYIACTAFGIIFYMLLPNNINVFGANISRVLIYYGGIATYFDEITANVGRAYFTVGIILLVIELILLLFSVIKKQYLLLFVVVLTDMLLTGIFVLWKEVNPLLIGTLNAVYCIWLGLCILNRQRSDTMNFN